MLDDDIKWGGKESKEKTYIEHPDLGYNRNMGRHWVDAPHDGSKNLKIALGSSHAGKSDLLWFSRNMPHGKFANSVNLNQSNEGFRRECEATFKEICKH